jgi:hypothetical protein
MPRLGGMMMDMRSSRRDHNGVNGPSPTSRYASLNSVKLIPCSISRVQFVAKAPVSVIK